jgi:AraC-like DNA-binding protein
MIHLERFEIEAEPMSSRTATASGPERSEVLKEFRNHESERRIQQTIAYMMEHVNQSLQVAKLAAMANMSPSHYTALFKRRTGCAPIDYFTRLRMQYACGLLMATSLIVKEVAAALGYEDPFYFSRVFKSVNQVAPSEYRVRSKEGKDALTEATPAHASLMAAGPDGRRLQLPIIEPLEAAGKNGDAKFFYEKHEKRGMFHSTTKNLCHGS